MPDDFNGLARGVTKTFPPLLIAAVSGIVAHLIRLLPGYCFLFPTVDFFP